MLSGFELYPRWVPLAYGVQLRDCGAWVYVVDDHLHDCLIYHYLHHQINAIY